MTGTEVAIGLIRGGRLVTRLVIVGCGALVLALILLEAVSHVVLMAAGKIAPRLRTEPVQYEGEKWLKTMRREEVATNRYLYQPYVVWRRPPFDGETIRIDEAGLRRTTNSQCDDRALRVFLFGGSALWGSGSPDWGTIPSQFAKILQEHGRPACVRNFGESGYVSSQEMVQLILALKAGEKPDLVIFYDGWNDISVRYQNGIENAHANLYDIKQKFEASPVILALGVTKTATLFDRIMTGLGMWAPHLERHRLAIDMAPVEQVAGSIQTQYLRNVEMVEALANHYGFKYAFFWQPMILAEGKTLTDQEMRIFEESSAHPDLVALTRATYRVMRAVRQPQVFYFGDVFKDRVENVYVDWVHIDPEANRFVASRIYETLERNESIPRWRAGFSR